MCEKADRAEVVWRQRPSPAWPHVGLAAAVTIGLSAYLDIGNTSARRDAAATPLAGQQLGALAMVSSSTN